MNLEEVLKLHYFVQSLSPSQAATEHTSDAWAIVLDDISYEDAKQAVINIAKNTRLEPGRSLYIDPTLIRTEVRRIRGVRVDSIDFALIAPPPDLTPAEYRAWLRELRNRAANGETLEQLDPPRPLRRAITAEERNSIPKGRTA